jgi:hypothetical protein
MSSYPLSKNFKIKVIILPVVSYRCKTWSLTLREEQRFGVFENSVLREIFGHMREELAGDWRRLHNEKLYNLYD